MNLGAPQVRAGGGPDAEPGDPVGRKRAVNLRVGHLSTSFARVTRYRVEDSGCSEVIPVRALSGRYARFQADVYVRALRVRVAFAPARNNGHLRFARGPVRFGRQQLPDSDDPRAQVEVVTRVKFFLVLV